MSGIFRQPFLRPPTPPVVLSYVADIVAPVLSSPLGTETGLTTADGTVSTDDSTGTLYWVVTGSGTSPSVAQIQAGQDHLGVAADASGNQAISGLGTQTVNATGITTGVARYFHFQQQDSATNDSTVVSSAFFILVAPVLDTQSASATSSSTGDGYVDTDEAGGTLYWVVTQSITQPSAAQIKAGQDHLGAAADDAGSQAVPTSGTQGPIGSTGLVTSTGYYYHFIHSDAAANDSNIVTTNLFTTNAAPVLSSPTASANGATRGSGTVTTDAGDGTLYWVVTQSATTPTVAQIKAVLDHLGAAADDGYNQPVVASGSQVVSVSRLTPETTYYIHFVHTDLGLNNSNAVSSASFITSAVTASAGSSALMRNVMKDVMRNVTKSAMGVLGGSSYSGSSWANQTSGTSEILRSCWFQGTRWVACGDNGTILTSDNNGLTWTARTSGVTDSLRTVKYWGGYWWIVGWGTASAHTILRSPDGVTWTPITVGGGGGGYLVTIGWTNGLLAFGGWEHPFDATSGLLVTTTDGTTFTWRPKTELTAVYGLDGVGSTLYVAGSANILDDAPYLGTTTDGGATALTSQTANISTIMTDAIYSISHSANRFVFADAVGNIGYTTLALASQTQSVTYSIIPWRVTYGINQFMLTGGNSPDGRILRSIDDGENFESVYSDLSIDLMSKAIFGPGYWLAVGHGGRIAKSTN